MRTEKFIHRCMSIVNVKIKKNLTITSVTDHVTESQPSYYKIVATIDEAMQIPKIKNAFYILTG